MTRHFLVHYSEIGLKGKNRPQFEKRLVLNIERHLKDLGAVTVKRATGAIILDAGDTDMAQVAERLKKISGIAYFFTALKVEKNIDAMMNAGAKSFEEKAGRFRVTAKRSDKSFKMTSDEIAREVGGAILRANGNVSVDLHTPEHVCFIEVTSDGAYVASEKTQAVGGLPVGSGGKLVSMISGGIDSPVASAMLLKRGAPLHFVHFHNYPYTDKRSIEIVKDIIARLNANAFESTVSFVNLTPIQEEVVANCDEKMRVVLYRRMMFRIAERIALREGAGGIVTGESLGQVASQTVENMRTIEAVTTLPIMRPLIGMDKEEIVTIAKRFGTYEDSIQPHSDCCSLFIPKHPATRTTPNGAEINETKLDVEKLIEQALEKEERVVISERVYEKTSL